MAKVQRKERIPVNGNRDILTVRDKDDDYEYRWVLDIPGRLEKFKDAGWEVVEDAVRVGQNAVDSGSRLGTATIMTRGTQTLVLMRVKREWYDEDQLAKQELVDAREETMMQEARQGRIEGQSGFYGGSVNVKVTK